MLGRMRIPSRCGKIPGIDRDSMVLVFRCDRRSSFDSSRFQLNCTFPAPPSQSGSPSLPSHRGTQSDPAVLYWLESPSLDGPWAHLNGISQNSSKSHFNFQEKLCRNWIRLRMTQNSSRNHGVGPVCTLARGAESAIHESTGVCISW